MNLQWNPYFIPKENIAQLNNVSFMRFDENSQQPLYNKQIQLHKKIQIQVNLSHSQPTFQPECMKYKRNKKQQSCVPFQMNVPQQTSNQTLTKVAQLSLKPIFSKPKSIQQNTQNENLKGSAVWERKDFQNQQITFESFLKEQNLSRNNSIEHNSNKSHFKKNHRQYSHVVQGNSGAYFMISNIPQNNNTNTTNSYYSNCENCNSHREDRKVERINVPKFFIPEDTSNQFSERTIKKQSPNNLIKHKKNTRCISMGEQKQIGLTLECDESSITIISDNANTVIPNPTNSKNYHTIINENNNQNSQIGGFSQETLQVLMLQEIEYAPNCDYLQQVQIQITPLMRAILMDWMIEVCSVYLMKRDTYYLAVAYVDSYLSKKIITKHELQLLGTASMLIASKMEEVEAKNPKDFEKASNYGYSIDQIYEMEKEICKTLQWHLNLPNINLWIEFYTNQWDNYISDDHKKFRSNNSSSFKNILKLQGYIDCCYLDFETLSYQTRKVVAAFMYLVLAVEYEQFTKEYIYYEIPKTTKFILADSQKSFNKIFTEFAQISFGFNLVDLIEIIKYASKFIMLDFKYSDTFQDKISIQRHEDLLIYQKYNQTGLSFIRCRLQK
ncbi:unnamed protein product (macronuclear) [Paramecium tetraurelia]|uniref:Cyclin-like domain-containing protein n=1 Tax=Paramecium tetraurelia TaxID=5888 RepID=A0BC18_PARTE|nr:uncharacterized protein GSPATT00000521001 [Paramecium tetraurelia]CAK56085.1 unnamed protein product [Paramecium tetraurelia]|eukprot:XP_001423483.1 hypothetical protein (macronuclear) [Paramecium tetraurelia strain d4-2]